MPTLFFCRGQKFINFDIYHSNKFDVIGIIVTFQFDFNAYALVQVVIWFNIELVRRFINNSHSHLVLNFDLSKVKSYIEILLVSNLIPLKVMDNLDLPIFDHF